MKCLTRAGMNDVLDDSNVRKEGSYLNASILSLRDRYPELCLLPGDRQQKVILIPQPFTGSI
jgi:hypothetical protein